MVCCKANKFGHWCEELPIVYTDNDSKDYCLFHAPKEHKGLSIEAFKWEVHGLIQAAITAESKCDLSGTVFPGAIDFQIDEDFDSFPAMVFKGATFWGKADFSSAYFSGEANFENTTFFDEADFRYARFPKATKANFNSVHFSKLATFSAATFMENADFSNAIFEGYANFSATTFDGDAHFDDAYFKNGAIFQGWPRFEKITFRSGAFFKRVWSDNREIFFREVNFAAGSVSFLDTDLANFRFERCIWPQKIAGRSMFSSEDTEVFHDEIQADQDFVALPWKKRWSNTELPKRYAMVEDLYRQMKQQAKEKHNEPQASKWHYREKEMFRKKKMWRRYVSLTWLYWAASGYGERPVKAGLVLLGFCTMVPIAMNWVGLKVLDPTTPINGVKAIQGFSLSWPWDWDWAKFNLLFQTAIEYSLFVKEPILKIAPGFWAGLLTLWTKLIIPVQATLFVFALRNKFRR